MRKEKFVKFMIPFGITDTEKDLKKSAKMFILTTKYFIQTRKCIFPITLWGAASLIPHDIQSDPPYTGLHISLKEHSLGIVAHCPIASKFHLKS